MKKNVIGNMTAPKGSKRSLFRRLNILPRILCLLLALLIWLAVINTLENREEKASANPEATLEEAV